MPYGRKRSTYRRRVGTKKKTTSTRGRTYRRKSYRKARTFRPKWRSAVSQKARVKFTYADTSFSRTLNAVGGYSAMYVFRGMGPFDPDYTGFGVQPYAWDDYLGANKFANYICFGSKISVFFRPEADYATMRRLHVSVIPCRNAAPTLTDISDVRMMPLRKGTTYDGLTESTRGARLQHYSSFKRVCGVSNVDYSAEGSYLAAPGIGWYWLVHFYTDVFDDEEVDIYFDVKITYYCKLSRGDEPDES